jgi:TRAP-type C4-dicarboxylate transport system permease large subunit
MFFMFLYKLSVNTSNSYAVIMLLIFTHSMICFMIFEIKICHKIPKNLTHIIFKIPKNLTHIIFLVNQLFVDEFEINKAVGVVGK